MQQGTITAEPRTQVIIKRPRLTKLLDESGARVLLLVAPAGYGKTTLAREWTAEQERVGWYSGGPAMMDVAGLSVGLAEVLGRMGEPARNDMVERVRILAARGHDPRGLAKAVSVGAPGGDWLLVVDDYHHALGSAESEEFFEELVALTEFRLLITSRERPGWLAARKVVYGEAAVVEMDALAFTDDEALAVLGEEGETFMAEAAGWPAVIGLAAMRGVPNQVAGLAPDDLYRFFAEDLLQSARPALREAMFLLALVGGASDATHVRLLGHSHRVLVAEATDRGFVTRREDKVLVHPLLRGFLLNKLAEFDGEDVAPLIGRAVTYLVADDRWDDAVIVLEEFPQVELVLSPLAEGLASMLDAGRINTIRRWLRLALNLQIVDPLIQLAEAEIAVREGHNRRARALGERAAQALTGDLAARAYVTAARAAHLDDAASEAMRLSDLGVTHATTDSTRIGALWTAFTSSLEQAGSGAGRILKRLEEVDDGTASHACLLLVAQAYVLFQEGRVHDVRSRLDLALEFMPQVQDPFIRTTLLHQLAYSHLLAAEYELAITAVDRLIAEGRDAGLQFVIDHGHLKQVTANIGLRRLGVAQRGIDNLERAETTDFVLTNLALQRVRMAIAAGDLRLAQKLIASQSEGTDRLAFRGEVRGFHAIVMSALGRPDAATEILDGDDECFEFAESGSLRDVARAIIALQVEPSDAAGQQLLHRAFEHGELDAVVVGYRAFPRLAAAASHGRLAENMKDLLSRSRDSDLARSIGLDVPRERRRGEGLSAREQQVYDLLVQGLSNHAIAKALFISESTTKVHVRHIFEKLGVHSRAEAARLAASDGLLADGLDRRK